MNKIHSICTLALMLPLCAFAQYDGTPMNKTGDSEEGWQGSDYEAPRKPIAGSCQLDLLC